LQNKAKVKIGKMNINIAAIKDYGKNNEQPTTNVSKTKPNKAKVKIGKMNISIATIKDYDNEQRTINNERYSKQSRSNRARKVAISV